MPCHLSEMFPEGLRWQGGSLKRGCLAHGEIAGPRLFHRGHLLIAVFTREKESSLSNSSARSACEPHELIPFRVSATVGLEPREADGCPSFQEKRGRREQSFLIEKNSVHADCPLENIACVLLAQTKDAKIVCVIRCQITRTWTHTSLKRLASARHSNSRKSFLPVECMLQTKQSLKTKKRMTYFPGAPLYCGRAGSDVIGCRRPTGGLHPKPPTQ